MLKLSRTTIRGFQMSNARITGILIAIIFIAAVLLAAPVSAKTTFNSTLEITNITSSSITWSYTYLTVQRPIGAALDGVEIEGWKTDYVYNYTASELAPNTIHEFCIFGTATSNCESGKTLPSLVDSSSSILAGYAFFIIAVVCIIIGVYIPFIAFAGAFFAIMGIIDMQNVSFWGGFLFMIVFCSAVIVGFGKLKGD
jgi:hypothetical protein